MRYFRAKNFIRTFSPIGFYLTLSGAGNFPRRNLCVARSEGFPALRIGTQIVIPEQEIPYEAIPF